MTKVFIGKAGIRFEAITKDIETPEQFVEMLARLPTYRERKGGQAEAVLDGLITRARRVVEENKK